MGGVLRIMITEEEDDDDYLDFLFGSSNEPNIMDRIYFIQHIPTNKLWRTFPEDKEHLHKVLDPNNPNITIPIEDVEDAELAEKAYKYFENIKTRLLLTFLSNGDVPYFQLFYN